MLSDGAYLVLYIVGSGLIPAAGVGVWLLGWALHGIGRPTSRALRFVTFAVAVGIGGVMSVAIGSLQRGADSVADVVSAMVVIGVPLVLALVLAYRGHRRSAGLVLAGVTLPWTLGNATYLVDIVQGVPWDLLTTIAMVLIGGVPLVIGSILAILDDPVHEPDPRAPAGRPGSRRIGSLTRALVGGATYGPVNPGLLLAFGAVTILGIAVPTMPLVAVAGGLAVFLIGTEIHLRLVPPALRPALEAMHWTGRHELARFRRVTGGAAPTSVASFGRWLEQTPETDATRAVRVEVLTSLGRFEEAAAELARITAVTPEERFTAALLAEDLAWRRGGPADMERLRALAAEIGPADGEDRLLAEGRAAWLDTEVRLAALDASWREPFATLRPRLPGAAGLHATMLRRPNLLVAAPLVVILALLGLLGR